MPRRHRFESEALQYLHDRYIGDDPKQRAVYEEELANAEVARAIYELRSKRGLSQRALADLVGTTASVISRLEDAQYDGHSLAMLRRIAAACDRRLVIRFVRRWNTRGVRHRRRRYLQIRNLAVLVPEAADTLAR